MNNTQVAPAAMPKRLGSETDVAGVRHGLHLIAMCRPLVASLLFAAMVGLPAMASEPDWSNKSLSYFASEQPLRDVLTNVAGYQGMKLTVSPEVKQTVSLKFDEKPVKDAFFELVQMNDLVWYFDGQVMFIYTSDEIKTATVKLEKMSPTAFTSAVKESGINVDADNWRVSEQDGLVFLSGSARFVEQVMELAKSLEYQTTAFVYKWKDENGQTHYSSSPPEGDKRKFDVLDLRLSQAREVVKP